MKTHLLLPAFATLTILPCVAQSTDTPPLPAGHGRQIHIDRREANLDKRIDQGVAKGKLTTEQASNLDGKLNQLKQDEARALQNDGKISRSEGQALNAEANKLSHEIHQAKHPGKGK
jgi:type IV pilus biogenesis protein CpaD/CtpE